MKPALIWRPIGRALGCSIRILPGLPPTILWRHKVRRPNAIRRRLQLRGFGRAQNVHSPIFLVQHGPSPLRSAFADRNEQRSTEDNCPSCERAVRYLQTIGGRDGPFRQHHGLRKGCRKRRVLGGWPPPKPVKGDGQRPCSGAGKRARGAAVEPYHPPGQPDGDRPQLLRALRANPARPGGGRRDRRRPTGNPTRPASRPLPTGHRAVRHAGRDRLSRAVS